jgi:carbamoyl-phosphate synthase large subunit
MTPRIAITGAGGAAAIGVMRAIADDGFDTFALDADPAAAGLYLVRQERRAIIPQGREPGFGRWMLDWCIEQRVDVLVPTVEAEFAALAAVRDAFAAAGIGLVLEDQPTILACTDKWALSTLMPQSVPQARTELLDEAFRPDGWAFPVIVKPRCASGSRGVRLVGSAEELAQVPHDGTMIVQEHLPGAEYSVDVLCDDAGGVIAAVPRERIKIDSGIAVASRTVVDAELCAVASSIATAVGIRHMANVQLRRDRRGRPRLLEVNARIPGTVALTIAAGVNMPRHVVRRALGLPVDAVDGRYAEVAMVRLLEDIVVPPGEIEALAAAAAPVDIAVAA